ncbi:MAG: class I SAM-dependent methyltransferase, partial [Desulfovibrionaceae bacterium]
LMIGQYIQARRNGFTRIESWGIENDHLLGERTFEFCRDLRVGIVVPVDAKRPEAYSVLHGKKPVSVANETISAMSSSISAEDFLAINHMLFSTMRGKLNDAHFFPEGLIVYAREQNVSVLLTKSNAFLGPKEYRHMHMYPQGLIIEGQITPLHSIGEEFLRFFPPESRWMLHRRW